jgi:hypothetical protein
MMHNGEKVGGYPKLKVGDEVFDMHNNSTGVVVSSRFGSFRIKLENGMIISERRSRLLCKRTEQKEFEFRSRLRE